MRVERSPQLREHIRDEYFAMERRAEGPPKYDGRKERTAYLEGWAKRLCISMSTLHAWLKLNKRAKRTQSAKYIKKWAYIRSCAIDVFNDTIAWSDDLTEASIDLCFEYRQRHGLIKSWVKLTDVYKAIREMNLKNEHAPIARIFEMAMPGKQVQIDFSFARIVKHRGNGDLITRTGGASKPSDKDDDRRVMYCVGIDDKSRVISAVAVLAKGEDTTTVHQCMLEVFARKPERSAGQHDKAFDFLLQGMPEAIYVDNSSVWKKRETAEGLAKLGIKLILGDKQKDSYGRRTNKANKGGRGKVERTFGSVKRNFEKWLQREVGNGYHMTLDHLNALLKQWAEQWNYRKHPRSGEIKWDVFRPFLETAQYPPEDALALFSRRIMKKVRSRLIRVGPNLDAIAPMFINDGEEVEIVQMNGIHYVFHNGERHPLQYQVGSQGIRPTIVTKPVETEQDVFSSIYLNIKFSQEMKAQSGDRLSIQSLSEGQLEELDPFFNSPQTLGAIRAKVRELLSQGMQMPGSNVIVYNSGMQP